jgi:hypothetical protein
VSESRRAGATARRRLLAATALSVVALRTGATPQVSSETQARIREILDRARAQSSASATLPEKRIEMLAAGERALAEGDTEAASTLFERAGFIKHAADAELGLIRTYMQQGEYRRALAFAAHTAGAHPDVAAGNGLYAWLLHLGAQQQIARLLLERARVRLPGDPLLADTEALLKSPEPRPGKSLLQVPARFAPFSPASTVLPPAARVMASGLLVRDGKAVLTAFEPLEAREAPWVRDGIGRVAAARTVRRHDGLGIAELLLLEPLVSPGLELPPRDGFAGSPVYLIEFVAGPASLPAWPFLRIGFLGQPSDQAGLYGLGIEVPAGPRGGPVFNAAGHLAGLSLADAAGRDRLVAASRLRQILGDAVPTAAAHSRPANIPADELYERALRLVVQVIG